MLLFVNSEEVESKLVKLEASQSVIRPPVVSVLCLLIQKPLLIHILAILLLLARMIFETNVLTKTSHNW